MHPSTQIRALGLGGLFAVNATAATQMECGTYCNAVSPGGDLPSEARNAGVRFRPKTPPKPRPPKPPTPQVPQVPQVPQGQEGQEGPQGPQISEGTDGTEAPEVPPAPTVTNGDQKKRDSVARHLTAISDIQKGQVLRGDRDARQGKRLGHTTPKDLISRDVLDDCLGESTAENLCEALANALDCADPADLDKIQARIMRIFQLVIGIKCFPRAEKMVIKKLSLGRVAEINGTSH